MTDASFDRGYLRAERKPETVSLRLPQPQPFGAPVFVHDCVTPLAGETVLSLLLKRMDARPEDD